MVYKPQRKVSTEWSSNLAYAIGLLASDGNLSNDGRHISFKSADKELVETFKSTLNLKNTVGKSARGGEQIKKYFYVGFVDIVFYSFLNRIGLTSAKSKTIKSVDVPEKFFRDFLRGLFDGDGTFYTFWDTRWPNSFAFKIAFASASIAFVKWLKEKLSQRYAVRGYTHKGAGVFNLEYSKGDTKILFATMYYQDGLPCLERKYLKLKNAFKKDSIFGLAYLQKQRIGKPTNICTKTPR